MTIAVRWTAGRQHGLAWPGGVALLHGSLPLPLVGELLEGLVARPGDLAEVCRRLDSAVPTVPAAVAVHADGVVAAALRTPDGWTRQQLGRVAGVRLVLDALPAAHDPAPDPVARPLQVGMVPAESLVWRVPAGETASAPAAERLAELPDAQPDAQPDARPDARPDERPSDPPSGLITGVPRHLGRPPAGVPPERGASVPARKPVSAAPERPSAATPDPAAEQLPEPDHDGLTVAQAVGRGARVEPQAGDPRSVLALVCPQGHPNPPSRPVCRSCLLALSGPARRVPRPVLGVVRGAGVEQELSAPVVVGRKPRRQAGSTEEPLLVPLAVPHVSGSHVELQIDGWTVLARDLESTNGTFLRRRGEPTMRLSSTPTPLVDGDVLDLGHGVQLTVEGMP